MCKLKLLAVLLTVLWPPKICANSQDLSLGTETNGDLLLTAPSVSSSLDPSQVDRKEETGKLSRVLEIYGNSSYGTTAAGLVHIHHFNVTQHWTVPLFYFQVPQKGGDEAAETVELANQAIMGLFCLLFIVGTIASPVLWTQVRPFDTRSYKDSFMDRLTQTRSLVSFMEADMINQIGLDKESCFMKTICQAHRSPEKYGMFGLPFRIFFPPPSENASVKVTSYQRAAGVGKYTETSCRKQYKCFFDFLDLANYAVDCWNSGSISKAITFV